MGPGVRRLSTLGRQVAVTVSVLMTVAVAAATAFAVVGGGGRSTDGPMVLGNPHGWATTGAVGDTFTDGMELLRLGGDQSAVIEDVRLVGDEGLELVGAKLAPPERAIGAVQYFETFPPTDDPVLDADLVDAEGTTITPMGEAGETWELLLGIRATREGYLVRTAVEVDYSVGDDEFTAVLPGHLAVCTSPDLERRGDCPAPPAPGE